METSAVPVAIDRLVDLLNGSADLAGVLVVDGPPAVNFTDRDRLYIGHVPSGEQVVDIQQSFASAGARYRDEQFGIACYAEAWAGDTDMRLRRHRVFAIVAAVEKALRATDTNPTAPTLNGAVLWSGLTVGSLAQIQDSDGCLAGVTFTVSCRARI
ncbi:hypothetical protein AB0D56_36275 [Streptomyces sp. NPDC048209]|uniref:hypothetical protein n=1 Tax=Streptomyces sp. NPDC048209 TaxID=3156689 RepID=UPI00341EE295